MSDAPRPLLSDPAVLLWAESGVDATGEAGNPLRRSRHPGAAAGDVGGPAHNRGMRTLEICERCDGTGADPFQHSEEIALCIECNGDGCHVTYYAELAQTA
jgi:hypothetical protein